MTIPEKIVFLFLQFSISAFGQSSKKSLEAVTLVEVIRFEGITYSGDHIFGIYPDMRKANEVIKDYMTRNKDNKYQLTYKYIYSGTVEVAKNENPHQRFIALCPKGYKLISKEEYNALVIMDTGKSNAALWYYMKTKKVREEDAKLHLKTLFSTYRKYMLE
jgi:lipoprotein NlpI